MPTFGTPDKFNPSKNYRHVLFGQEAHLTEWELNELQKIQRQSLADITRALTGRQDGVFSGTLTFNGTTVTATNLQALVAGELVTHTGTLAATNGDTVYLALTETTVARAQDADLTHPAFPSEETSRRIRYDVALTKSNADATKRYLVLGSIVSGNLVSTYNKLVAMSEIGSDDINVIAFKGATTLLADYPFGMTMFQYTTGDAGYPLTNALVTTYNPPNAATGYQTITGVQNNRVHQRHRHFNGTAWSAWAREDEIELLLARSITAGSGLTGGGTLAATRTLSVSFAGTGAATTVARSDHNHDTTYAPLARSVATGAGLTGGGDLSANRTLAVDFAGTGSATTVARSDHNHDTRYALLSTSITAGAGLTGGGDLSATRTLTVSFGGNGSATTVARSDHSHALTNLTDVTVTSPVSGHTLRHNGTSWVNGTPLLTDNSDVTITSPATGQTLRHNGTAWVNALPLLSDNSDVAVTSPASGHVLQHNGTSFVNRTLATAGIAASSVSISAGAGLTGGGDLTTSRTLAVNFAGTGSAMTAARSDHNHDTTYVGLAGGTMTGTLSTPNITLAGKSRFRNGGTGDNSLVISAASEAIFLRPGGDAVTTGEISITTTGISQGGKALATQEYADTKATRTTTITAGAGLTGGGDLTTNRTLAVSFGGNGAATTVARSDHNHDTTYAPLARSIATGAGLTGGGDLSANRTLTVSFAGTGSATTVARSDHNHDSTYVNLVSGTTQTVTSSLNLNGTTTINGSLTSPIGNAVNDGTVAATSLPVGLAWQGNNANATGYPSGVGSVLSFYENASRNFQFFHNKNSYDLHFRTWNDATASWMAFKKLALTDEVTAVDNKYAARRIDTGSGLNGGGDLTANRTLAVSWGGNGSATTVARSDHNHDTTYARLSAANTFTASNIFEGGASVSLRPGSTDHTYISFHARTASPTTRSAWMGFGSPGATVFHIKNELANGNIDLFPGTGGKTIATGTLNATGSLEEGGVALATKYAASARNVSAGAGLTGGGNLTADRSLAVNFAGTGAATTVARSDHNHDATYVNKTGDTMSGVLKFGAGQASALAAPVIAGINQGIEWNFDSDTYRLFGREDTSGELTALVLQMGDNANDRFVIEGMDSFSTTPNVLFELSKTVGLELNTDMYCTGTMWENGILLSTKYAASARNISAGAGLTGGGNLTADRSLAVSFAGTGSASTVARSDHNHDTTYVALTGGTMTGALNVPTINLDTANAGIEIGRSGASNTPFIDFRSSASVTDYDARIMGSGGSATVGAGTLQLIAASTTVSGTLSTTGAITEQGTTLGTKYAASARNISAGAGLLGGGNLTADRSFAVNFAGTGSASTVARSDHSHTAAQTSTTITNNTIAGTNVQTAIDELSMQSLKMTKSSKDANGVYTVVEYRRKTDNVLACTSTLSGGTSPQYTTRTVRWYGSAGTVIRTDTFTITYDADGDVVSEL